MRKDTSDIYKVVLVGDSFVGKSSLINRLFMNKFSEQENTTVSPGLFRTKIGLPNAEIPVDIWDTAGQERFNCMVPIYARNAKGVVLVFDLSNPPTFASAKGWYEQLKQIIDPSCQILICGNKEDLQNDFDIAEAAEWARKNEIPFVKVSAKSGYNVKEVFQTITQMIYDNSGEICISNSPIDDILNISEGSAKTKKKCGC